MSAPSPVFDVQRVRADFPILQQILPKGYPVTYLDTGASAQKPQCVIDREREIYESFYANAYRGVYRFGALVDEALEETRSTVARFIGADSSDEVIFTSGSTMSINLVAHGWGRKFVGPGDEILLNEMEHHANLVPWQMLAKERGAVLRYIPLTSDGRLDLATLDSVLTPRTKLLAVTGMSNVLGTINPVRELAERAHAVGAKILVDGAQSVPHLRTNVVADGIDFLAFSGHKLYGPSGVGILYGRMDLLQAMDPFLGGGHMIDRVYKDHSTWAEPPAKFEAGTLAITQAAALGTAVRYVETIGLEAAHAHEQQVLAHAHERLGTIDGLRIYGPSIEHKGAICSFTIRGVHPEDLAQLLDLKGVYVRHGHHCTMPLHDLFGVPATVRASFGVYSTREDVDRLVEAIDGACRKLR
jgi:cysteine desulfurase/selenocysteine lyase